MVIPSDEPDIVVGGDPSAPPIATAVPASTAAFNNPNNNIERTTNADGSLVVKATKTTRQPNGYRNVTIEYFYVPANMVGTVTMSMDATGEPPSSLYMTKMEQQVLPPGTGEVVSHAPSTAGATGAGGGGNRVPQAYTHQHTAVAGGRPSGGRGVCFLVFVVFIVIAISIAGIAGAVNNTNNHWPTPAPYSWNWPTPAPYPWNPPSPWNPTPWTPPTPNPTRDGCKDTPDWVDDAGDGCAYYEQSSLFMCRYSSIFGGPMGSAAENCCTCGGGSTYVAPTPRPSRAPIVSLPPSPRPTQSSACEDTPGWKDFRSNGCEFYAPGGFFCDFFSDAYKGDMGSAADNCCACGGGKDPSTSASKVPTIAPSNAPVPSVTPPNLEAVPTPGGKGIMTQSEKNSNLSNKNPFRSPTAAVAK